MADAPNVIEASKFLKFRPWLNSTKIATAATPNKICKIKSVQANMLFETFPFQAPDSPPVCYDQLQNKNRLGLKPSPAWNPARGRTTAPAPAAQPRPAGWLRPRSTP